MKKIIASLLTIVVVTIMLIIPQSGQFRDLFVYGKTINKLPAEHTQIDEKLITYRSKQGEVYSISGPHTKGATITIADERIKLPHDVFIKAYVVEASYTEENAHIGDHLPWFALQSDEALIVISEKTGFILNLQLGNSEQNPFYSLKKVIKGYLDETYEREFALF